LRLKTARMHAIPLSGWRAGQSGGHPVRGRPARWQADPRLPGGLAKRVLAELRLPELGLAEMVLGLLALAESALVEAAAVKASRARAV
jgi:hypothetical protein